jgi:hypothetical protein
MSGKRRIFLTEEEFKERQRKYNREYAKEWRKKNPERYQQSQQRRKEKDQGSIRRKRVYNLTDEKFKELIEACGGRCPVCLRPFDKSLPPYVDHCHATGVVRGILCRLCNCAEGRLKTPENVRKMIAYMERFELLYVVPKPPPEPRKKRAKKRTNLKTDQPNLFAGLKPG